MKHEVELELKTIVTEEQFYKLASFYQPLEFIEQHNYYFVTGDISHYGFRVRTKGDEKLFTLKNHVDGVTYEYEKVFEGNLEDDPEIVEVLNKFNVKHPYTLFGELITQRAIYFDGLAELCFDINHYNGLTDYELEYEVKAPHDHQKTFLDILAKAGIKYQKSWGSKYKRCLKTKNSD